MREAPNKPKISGIYSNFILKRTFSGYKTICCHQKRYRYYNLRNPD